MPAELLSMLAGLGRAGIAADTGAMQGAAVKRDREQRDLLAQLAQQRQAAQDAQEAERNDLLNALTRAQTAKLSNPAMQVDRQYDPVRGAIVDVNTGKVEIPQGLPNRPEPREPQGSFVQYVDAEGNPVAFNPTSGATVRAPQGLKPAGAAGDRNTAVVRKEVAANKANLSVLDDAIARITARPESVGLSRGVGKLPFMGGVADVVNQRMDPEGVEARASLANIGSLVIHDRSGAAVSIHEFPRLAPFIPDVSDTPEAALIKLRKLREAIAQETGELEKGTLLVAPPTRAPQGPSGGVDVNRFLPPGGRP